METIWLSIGALGMGLGTVAFVLLGLRAPAGSRYFFVITALITLIAFISYLVMATGQGSVVVGEGDQARVFYWARYIDWLFTTPLLLLDLALLALLFPRRSVGLISGIIALDVLMIVTGLGAGYSTNAFVQVVLFIISTAALVGVLYLVVTRLFAAARDRTPAVAGVFNTLAVLTIILWSLYPVVFVIGTEGFAAVGETGEVFMFLVLDLLAKVGFGFLLLTNRQALYESVGGGQAQASRVS